MTVSMFPDLRPDDEDAELRRHPLTGRVVRGRYNGSRKCDDRCVYAKGADCECSCAGRNHGTGWADAVKR